MSQITIDTDVELGELSEEELHQRLGEIERSRYRIADELKAVMDEFEGREGSDDRRAMSETEVEPDNRRAMSETESHRST